MNKEAHGRMSLRPLMMICYTTQVAERFKILIFNFEYALLSVINSFVQPCVCVHCSSATGRKLA